MKRVDVTAKRNVGLDIVRIIAISLVMFVHGSGMLPPELRPGYAHIWWICAVLGVELFFCLSGYLIGQILIETFSSNVTMADIRIFLVRRWMRTLPLYYFILAVAFFVPGVDPGQPKHALWYVVMFQNFAWPAPSGWFGMSWSLTIEEWSYLLLPLLGYWGLRLRSPLFGAASALIAAAFMVRICVSLNITAATDRDHWDSLIRKMAISRGDAIVYGMMTSLFIASNKTSARRILLYLSPVALILVFAASYLLCNQTALVNPVATVAVFPLLAIGLSMLLPTIEEATKLWPSIWPIKHTSRISYSLYLVHGYVISYCLAVPPSLQFITYIMAAGLISTLTYHAIESPFMRIRPKPNRYSQRPPQAPQPNLA